MRETGASMIASADSGRGEAGARSPRPTQLRVNTYAAGTVSAENPSTTSRPRCNPEPGTSFNNATKPNGAVELKCGNRVSGARVSAATQPRPTRTDA